MKVKKIIILCVLMLKHIVYAKTVVQSYVSTRQEQILGHVCKHIIRSDKPNHDEYTIDGNMVTKEIYEQQVALWTAQEQEKLYVQQLQNRQSRVTFVRSSQIAIYAKLIESLIDQLHHWLGKLEHEPLENFFVFTDATISSYQQLRSLQQYIHQLVELVEQKIKVEDVGGLQTMVSNLEAWPPRLEKFFEQTVQEAIKKSDDTMVLKELLTLVGEI